MVVAQLFVDGNRHLGSRALSPMSRAIVASASPMTREQPSTSTIALRR
ncbi:hypothetical protein [Mycobacterium sp. GA-2829]|nr:hypothetical protein [Mycobacterium sp. GA-2829]